LSQVPAVQNPAKLFANLFNVSPRASDGCIFDADPSAAHDAVKAAFFAQPSNRLAMTLPAFRASRVDPDIIE